MSGSIEEKYIAWRNRYLRSYADGFYIYYKEPKEKLPEMTCSEAHGYGMLISVLKRNQQDFDGLCRYFLRFRNRYGLMQWQQQQKGHQGAFIPGGEGGENCATDGDVDIATALFLAAKIWGHGGQQREIDYRAIAIQLCGAIWEKCINHRTHMPLVGDWCDEGDDAYKLTRPSDFILSGYLLFAREDTQRSQQWHGVCNAIINEVQRQFSIHPNTGLLADFLQLNRQGVYEIPRGEVLEDKHDPDYNWNSCRVPWRLGHYYLQTRDERLGPVLNAQANFFSQELRRHGEIRAGYHLNGKSFVDYTDMAFLAPVSFLFWVLGRMDDLNKITSCMNEQDENTYFGETIAMLCLLQSAVQF
ncbi:hypothetical protein INT44_005955 [Umbelopsis vinacea]|uniref:Uncharacterized protein n=1 Tax=Umbelopsis vinacea TaxID=44442 RepID=A0A8H7Q0U6_9FUNG|nr:hypothetical protein INT44_005955 [Umbelopsis vinacea]